MKDTIILNENELKIVKDQTLNNDLIFNPLKKEYTIEELASIGIVRESYSVEELNKKGFSNDGVVTSFDEISKRAKEELQVGTPFAKEIKKWQIPVNIDGFKMMTTIFPKNTVVLPHVHTVLDENIKSGGFRMVVQGSITYEGKKYLPGDWFFIPNGIPYSFTTDKNIETKENYFYEHRSSQGAVRISSPKKV